jgi:aspartate/methionine/tyrosine aminotransferase
MPAPLAEHLTRLMTNSASCTATFVQLAGLAALEGDDASVRTMVEEFRHRRDLLVDGLNRLPGVTCTRPRGAFYVFPNVKGLRRPSKEIAQHLLDEGGVALLWGTAFGEFGEGYLRLSYAASREALERALERMGKALARLV